MNLKKGLQIIVLFTSVLALFACTTHKRPDASAVSDANAAYDNDAQSSGLGDESGFNDQARGGQGLSKRTYYFDFDSNIVREEDKPAIFANAHYLTSHPAMKVIVEGNTDPRGSREYNIGLGERRAKAVADLLYAKGVSASQIRIVSYGSEKLAAAGRTESDYQLDRRVVLAYLQH